MEDRGLLITHFEGCFGEKIDHEVIKIILQECQWDVDVAHAKLLELTGMSEAGEQDAETVTPPIPITWPSPQTKENTYVPFTRNCNLSFNNNNSNNSFDSNGEISDIKRIIEEKDKVLIIMRGLPGSGKSTLCHSLNKKGVVLSADDYFYDKFKNYNFNPKILPEAHRWNLDMAKVNMSRAVSPIFIDNTNLQIWEFEPYITYAIQNDYYYDFLEPQTAWRYECNELAKRCIHNIPKWKIEEMKERFESNISLENISGKFHSFNNKACYDKGDEINEMISKLNINESSVKDKKELSDSKVSNNEILEGEALERGNQDLSNEETVQENKITNELFSNLVSEFSFQIKENVKKSSEERFANSSQDIDSNDEEMYEFCSNLEDKLGKPIVLLENEEVITEKIDSLKNSLSKNEITINDKNFDTNSPAQASVCPKSLSNWNSLEKSELKNNLTDWHSENDVLNEQGQFTNVSKPPRNWNKKPNIQPALECVNQTISDRTCHDAWDITESNLSSWEVQKDENQATFSNNFSSQVHTGAVPKRYTFFTDTTTACSENVAEKRCFQKHKCTQYATSDYCNFNESGLQILIGNSSSFIPGLFEVINKPPKKLYLDKGCMTDSLNDSILEESDGLDMLITFFPDLPKNSLKDVYEKCGNDLDWAMNILIDGGYQLSEASDGKSSCSNIEPALSNNVEPSMENDEHCENINISHMSPEDFEDQEMNINTIIPKRKSQNGLEINFLVSETIDDRVRRLTQKEYKDLNISKLHKVEPPENNDLPNNKNDSTKPTSGLNDDIKETDKTQYLTLEVDSIFASQLVNIFGPISSLNIESGFTQEDRRIILPLEICHQVHKYWAETLEGKFKDESEILDKLIREDEELAKQLQREEDSHNLNILKEDNHAFDKDPPRFFQEISDIEKAIELSKAELPANTNGSSLSNMLTLQKLQEEFNHIDPSAVEEEYTVHSSNYDKTRSLLSYKFGAKSSNARLSEATNINMPSNKLPDQGRDELMVGDDDVGIEIINPQVYRDEAQMHFIERKKAIQKAQDASRQGMKSVASYYAQIGNLHFEKLKEANERASKKILNAVNANKGPNTLDLHMLHVTEALQEVQRFLSERKSFILNRKLKLLLVDIITGKGIHSAGGEARLKPAIRFFLTKEGYGFQERPGSFQVTLIPKNDV